MRIAARVDRFQPVLRGLIDPRFTLSYFWVKMFSNHSRDGYGGFQANLMYDPDNAPPCSVPVFLYDDECVGLADSELLELLKGKVLAANEELRMTALGRYI